jgi:penicillin-binding protein 1A
MIKHGNVVKAVPRRIGMALFWLMLIGGGAFGLLLFETPSASQAAALVGSEAKKRGIVYPSPDPPLSFTKALLATEDHRFDSPFDPGVDPVAVARVAVGQILAWRDQGGSTIEQQLAKMLYTPRQHGFGTKIEQVVLAIKLRFTYSRPEILAMYAEVVYFGNGYYGLESASCGYFGRQAAELTWTQAAMLAGVLNGPSLYNPRTHLEAARRREAHVLKRLVAVSEMTEAQAKAALAEPLGLSPARAIPPKPYCSRQAGGA